MMIIGAVCTLDEIITLLNTITNFDPSNADDLPWDEDEDDEWNEDEYDEDDEILNINGCPLSCPYVEEGLEQYCPAEMGLGCNWC